VVTGLKNGFPIGFDYANSKATRSHSNMLPANENPQVVDEYLQHEIE